MSIFATVDAEGRPAFYIEDVSPEIPEGAFAVPEADWLAFFADQAGHRFVDGKLVVHTPPATPVPPRCATGRALRYALNAQGWRAAWETAVAAAKPDDRDYWDTLGSGDAAPETNPKLARIARAAGVDLAALFTAATAS